jgi:hypothetical protein
MAGASINEFLLVKVYTPKWYDRSVSIDVGLLIKEINLLKRPAPL